MMKSLFLVGLTVWSIAGTAVAQRAGATGPMMSNPPVVAAPAPRPKAATPAQQPTPIPTSPMTSSSPTTKATGGAATQTGAPATTDVAGDRNYILGAADVIEVSVLGRSEYSTRARVSEDGTIQLQYLGVVQAASKTAAQFGDEVAAALEKGGYFSHPVVRVDVVSYASRYVTVLGNFGSPGLVPVDRAYRLSEIVARVGGVREGGADFVILRPQHGAERHIAVATLATGGESEDPYVSPGDKIYSPPAELFYATGQVKQAGAFPIIPDMTLRMAISRAGGLTDSGSDKRVTITRKGVKLGRVELDAKIQPGDVIVVGERLF